MLEGIISGLTTVLFGGGLLLWFGKLLLDKSLQAKIDLEKDKINLVRHSDLEFKKLQVQSLYGPLYGILKTNRKIYDLWMDGKLGEVNLKVKHLFKENNQKANEIIINNAHLVDTNPMPECFVRYATSTLVWSMYCADSEDGALPQNLSEYPDIKWPKEFEDHIFKTYEKLANELSVLYETYEIKK